MLGWRISEGKRLGVWPVAATGKHVGGRVTHSGILPRGPQKMCGGEGSERRSHHSRQSLGFADSGRFLAPAGRAEPALPASQARGETLGGSRGLVCHGAAWPTALFALQCPSLPLPPLAFVHSWTEAEKHLLGDSTAPVTKLAQAHPGTPSGSRASRGSVCLMRMIR